MVQRRQPGGFYGIQGLNLSNTSLDSNALLDHREQHYMRPRRSSTVACVGGTSRRFPVTGFGGETAERLQTEGFEYSHASARPGVSVTTPRGSTSTGKMRSRGGSRKKSSRGQESDESLDSGDDDLETTRLLGSRPRTAIRAGGAGSILDISGAGPASHLSTSVANYGGVNFPPSVPTSPRIEPSIYLDGANALGAEPISSSFMGHRRGNTADTVINIEPSSSATTPPESGLGRQPTLRAEEDVCFPVDECLSDEQSHIQCAHERNGRRIPREWPDLGVLEEWSREEKEQRSEGIRAKKTAEPVYVGGRLRPNLRTQWHREEEDAPYRFTYFNDELPATLHAHTISELLLPGQTYKDLFRPEPRKLEEYSDAEEEQPTINMAAWHASHNNAYNQSHNLNNSGPNHHGSSPPAHDEPMGARPTFWLDVLSPTDAEMKVLSKAFGIHPLTAEDIMMQEAREKVELFRSYYLVSYKSFEQDMNSEDYLDPVNMYVTVFREGVISVSNHSTITPRDILTSGL